MNLVQDFSSLVGGCLALQVVADRPGLVTAGVIGVLLGATCWFACSRYSKMWNLRFQPTVTHHFLCLVAALITLVGSIVFEALKYTKEAAYVSVGVWVVELSSDALWSDKTFVVAYNKVKNLGLEDFTNYPPPSMGGHIIPLSHPPSILAAAGIYANGAAQHFRANRPFLSIIVHAKSELPFQILDADLKNFFATEGKTYPFSRGVTVVAQEVKRGLDEQIPQVVTLSRSICVGLFLIFQFIPFGLVGLAASRDIKIIT